MNIFENVQRGKHGGLVRGLNVYSEENCIVKMCKLFFIYSV